MNEEIVLKMVEPYVVNSSITYKEFDQIFDILSLREQYQVVKILISHSIDLQDDSDKKSTNDYEEPSEIEFDVDLDDEFEIEDESSDSFEIRYDENLFHDGGRAEMPESVVQYSEIKQSNTILCLLIQKGSLQAKNDICVKNKRLVQKYANAYFGCYGNDLDMDDLLQAGFIGLLKAAERFDDSRDNAFSTYAVIWIKQSISRELIDRGFTIRVPVHIMEKISKVTKLDNKYEQEAYDYAERIELIANELNCTVDQVSHYMSIRAQFLSCTSLNIPVGEEGDTELGELVEDSDVLLPDEIVAYRMLPDIVNKVLSTLTPREEKVLRLRFGLDDGCERTLEEVGHIFGVTRERIRQIEAKALRKLRHPSRSKEIKEFL